MSWLPKIKTVQKAILASAIAVFSAAPALSQGYEDDYAQDWTQMDDYVQPIQQVGCFKSKSSCNGGCDAGCDSCCVPCCPPWWAHRSAVVGQWLFLRPGNTDIVYTIEQNNLPANEFPTGPVGYTAIDAESGARLGFSHCIDQCSSWVGSVTTWRGQISDVIDRTNGNILVSEILHPSRLSAGAAALQERASHSIDFQMADLAYRRIYKRTNNYAINWKAGLQYGNMEQDFDWDQTQPASVAVGTVSADTEIDFDGWGLMGGIDMERHDACTGLSIYGKGTGSALAGEWNAFYRDSTDQIGGGVIANQYKDFRVTPVLELELGVAWQSKTGHTRINCGYMNSAWYDAVSTRSYIDSFRQGRYVDIGETITFNGLVLGGELRF